jgi:subtilisin family serine protease
VNTKIIISLLGLLLTVTWSHAQQTVIVKLKSRTVPLALRSLDQRSLMPRAALSSKNMDLLQTDAQRLAFDEVARYLVVEIADESELTALRQIDGVETVYASRRIPLHTGPLTNDSLSKDQYALHVIGAKTAWQTATGDGVLVGVIDTGVDWNHPDLVDQLYVRDAEDINGTGRFEDWPSTVMRNGVSGDLNGVDDDGNGYVDDVIGFDVVDQSVRNIGDDRDRDAIPFDEQGHGTSVSGVIAARANNGVGIAGLAFGARLVTLRAFDATGNADEDDIASAIIYAALNGVHVLNMSFGDGVDSPAMRDAIRFAAAMGCCMVASAGNSGSVSRQFPAGYDDVIAVGSTNADDVRSPFSSTGSLVDLVAPGQNIVTTSVGSRYRTVNGTSFASPYVAAAAAMLLQKDPGLTPAEIRTILIETSRDLGDRGWDGDYGNGRLQVDAAVLENARSLFGITSPYNEAEATDTLIVRGSTLARLFDSSIVSIGPGIEPVVWTTIAKSNIALRDSILAVMDTRAFADGPYVIRLTVQLKDGRTLESRRRITIVNDDTLRFLQRDVVMAWKDDRRFPVVTVRTNRPTQCVIIPTISGVNDADKPLHTDIKRFSRQHSVLVDVSPWGTKGDLLVMCTADNGDQVTWNVTVDMGDIAAPVTGWNTVGSIAMAGYSLDDVRDLYGDGKPTFVMGDLSSGGFGPMVSIQRDQLQWVRKDSTKNVYIPRGMGDANGNGRVETFAHVVGRATLFESGGVGQSPFQNVIFDLNDGRSNAAGMADIDGDGREELLVIADTGLAVYTYRNDRFTLLAGIRNPTAGSPGSSGNRVDEISVFAADLDGDGRTEIVFGDSDGDLIICEYANGELRVEYVREGIGAGGSGYVAGGDVDGDGLPDVVHGIPDDPAPSPTGEYGRQVWTYTMLKAVAFDTYAEAWTERFHGVRYGIGYRNGVGVSQLDGQGGNEVVICVFPRLYIFGWEEGKGMKPLYYRPDVVTPRFLSYDFNGNGVNELGFGTTVEEVGLLSGFEFIEFSSRRDRLSTPAGMRASVITDPPSKVRTRVVVSWFPVIGAERYRVFYRRQGSGPFRELDTTEQTSIIIDTLSGVADLVTYEFQVSANAPSSSSMESARSAIVAINLRDAPTRAVEVTSELDIEALREGAWVSIRFDRPMAEYGTPPYRMVLSVAGIDVHGTSVSLAGDSTIIVTFPRIALADIDDSTASLIKIVRSEPEVELYLAALTVNKSTLRLHYSESVNDDALLVDRYTLEPRGRIERVDRLDPSTVQLSLASNPPLAALGSTYSLTARDVTATSGHLMTIGPGATLSFVLTSADLSSVFVYPQPASIGRDGAVTFANLTREATVEILDQRFVVVQTVKENDGNGGVTWNLMTSTGQLVPPGIYFYRIRGTSTTGSNEDSGLQKLMIKR